MSTRSEGRASVSGHSFVGRDRELEQIDALLLGGEVRLICIVGPGGIGKTRFAGEVFRRYPSGTGDVQVHWVRLARLKPDASYTDVEQVTVSSVVGTDFSERPAWDALVATLSSPEHRRSVLVLDNCEHVLGGVRLLISRLLDAISTLTIVTTSRGPIGWSDEFLIQVPPLDPDQALTHFRQRAELVGRPLSDPAQDAIAGDICGHVHHYPLYIQLAAGRLRHQPLAAILADLTGRDDDKRMSWSSMPTIGADPRHRAVTDVIAWSYNLSTPEERLLFERLSVFAAGHDGDPDNPIDQMGADLDAIQAICGDDDPGTDGDDSQTLPRDDIEGLLQNLVDHSLVTAHFTTTSVRWSLLETLRIFARKRLRERCGPATSEGPARLADRHLHYYRDHVATAAAKWFSPAERSMLDWAGAAWDNILVAIQTSLTTPGQAAAGLQICLGLITLRVPFIRGSLRDIHRWTSQCLDAAEGVTPRPTELVVAAKAALAWVATRQGRSADADRLLDQCALDCLPTAALNTWRDAEVDLGLPAPVDLAWGTQLFMSARDPRAIAVLVRARDKFRTAGNDSAAMMAAMFAGFAAGLLGSSATARDIAGQCVADARDSGASWATSWAELSWAVALIKSRQATEAVNVLRHALSQQREVGDQWGAAWAVEMLTWALAAMLADDGAKRSQAVALATEIAYLVGGVQVLRTRLGITIAAMGTFADESAKAAGAARRVLAPAAFTTAMAQGTQLCPESGDVYRLALGTPLVDLVHDSIPERPGWKDLSPAEREVARLAAIGYSYQEMATARRRSRRTIQAQMVSLRAKLEISSRDLSRDELIAYLPATIRSEVESEIRRRQSRRQSPAG